VKYYIVLLDGRIVAETAPPRANNGNQTYYVRTTNYKRWALGFKSRKLAAETGDLLNRNYKIEKL
jgi:hypothetical protein